MADIELSGYEELAEIFKQLANIPDDVVNEMMTTMANDTMKYQRAKGIAKGVYDADQNEAPHILDKMKVSKVKRNLDEVKIYITFTGKRTDSKHKKPARNAEIAFVNEFGRPNMKARPFMKEAIDENADKIVSSGAEIFYKWQEKTFLT